MEAQVDQLKSLVGISLLLGIILGILALLAVVFVWTRYRKLLKGNSVGDDFYTKKMNLIKVNFENKFNFSEGRKIKSEILLKTTRTSFIIIKKKKCGKSNSSSFDTQESRKEKTFLDLLKKKKNVVYFMIKNKVSLMKLDFHRLHETNKS